MNELTIENCYSHIYSALEFYTFWSMKIALCVKRQFKYWSNRAISTCNGTHVLITGANGNRGSANGGGVVTVGN